MSEAVEGGSALAWRLLATLEGGTLLLATSVLLAYTVTHRIVRESRSRRVIRTVLVTNTTNLLGRELKRRLEERGCVVETVGQSVCDVTKAESKVDAIVVVGAEPKGGLEGMATLVTEDIHNNLRVLESASSRLRPGGYLAWACAHDADGSLATTADSFSDAGSAFDDVLRTSLMQIAQLRKCSAVWAGRGRDAAGAAQRTVAALLGGAAPAAEPHHRFSLRNAALRIGEPPWPVAENNCVDPLRLTLDIN